ncbi:uncharacterized protein LAESUDRAFT_681804, partial [Laetiporus sulphureus 93-53]
LRREFRELEILDEITRLHLEDALPPSISGCTRASLVKTFQATNGCQYVPYNVEQLLDWSQEPISSLLPPPEPPHWQLLGKKVKRDLAADSNRPERSKRRTEDNWLPPSSLPAKRAKTITSISVPTTSSSAKHGSSFVLLGSERATPSNRVPSATPPSGLIWDRQNWSCAYDSVLTVLWNIYANRGGQFFSRIASAS